MAGKFARNQDGSHQRQVVEPGPDAGPRTTGIVAAHDHPERQRRRLADHDYNVPSRNVDR
jgi:hypothetical protein